MGMFINLKTEQNERKWFYIAMIRIWIIYEEELAPWQVPGSDTKTALEFLL